MPITFLRFLHILCTGKWLVGGCFSMWYNGTTHPGTFLGQVNSRQLHRVWVLYKSKVLSRLTDIENSFIGDKVAFNYSLIVSLKVCKFRCHTPASFNIKSTRTALFRPRGARQFTMLMLSSKDRYTFRRDNPNKIFLSFFFISPPIWSILR